MQCAAQGGKQEALRFLLFGAACTVPYPARAFPCLVHAFPWLFTATQANGGGWGGRGRDARARVQQLTGLGAPEVQVHCIDPEVLHVLCRIVQYLTRKIHAKSLSGLARAHRSPPCLTEGPPQKAREDLLPPCRCRRTGRIGACRPCTFAWLVSCTWAPPQSAGNESLVCSTALPRTAG